MDEKVHLVPTGYELDRVLWGLEYFGVTRLYLIRNVEEAESIVEDYVEKIKARYADLVEHNKLQEVFINTMDVSEIFNTCKTIIETEALKNQVFINISSSNPLTSTALVMTAWCCDITKMKKPPTIYFIRPGQYACDELSHFSKEITPLLNNFKSLVKEKPEELHAFLQRFHNFLSAIEDKGLSWGREGIIAIPYMPIKLPSEFEMELLAYIESFGGEVKNIQALVDGLKKPTTYKHYKDPNIALRAKVTYHLRNLESRQLVEKIPNMKGMRIKITPLGKVFVTPRILKKVKED